MSAPFTAQTIADELASTSEFVESQASLGLATLNIPVMKQQMASAIVGKIKLLPSITPAEAQIITGAIGRSCYEESSKTELATAVALRVSAGVGSVVAQGTLSTQTLVTPEQYLTRSDWDAINASGTSQVKIQIVVDRLFKIGLQNPTRRPIVLLLAWLLLAIGLRACRLPGSGMQCSATSRPAF